MQTRGSGPFVLVKGFVEVSGRVKTVSQWVLGPRDRITATSAAAAAALSWVSRADPGLDYLDVDISTQ